MSAVYRGFDFFASGELPAPQLSESEAGTVGTDMLGRPVTARSLGSQQDANFLLEDDLSGPLGVLKVPNEAFTAEELDAQTAATARLAAALPDLRFPTAVPSTRPRDLPDGCGHARILSFLGGGTLNGSGYLHPEVIRRLGTIAGRVSRALATFEHPGTERTLQWDLRHAGRVLTLLAPSVRDPARRRVVDRTLSSVWPLVEALSTELRLQVVHADLTDDNVVCTAEATLRRPDGVIDFGDLCRSWTVGELAVTVSSMLHHDGITPRDVLPAVNAFDREQPLRDAEIDALWPLVVVRGAVLVVSGTHQVEIDGSNAYAASGLEREWRILEVAAGVPLDVMRAAIRTALGRTTEPAALPPGHRALVAASGTLTLDLSSTSAALDRGRWLEPDVEHALAMDTLDAGAPAVTTAFDEFRMTRSVPLSTTAPATAATGIDAWFSGDTELRAPWPGVVSRDGEAVTLRGDEHVLTVAVDGHMADQPAATVATAALIGRVPARTRCRITVRLVRGAYGAAPDLPEFVVPDELASWRSVACDPTALLSDRVQSESRTDDAVLLLRRRAASFATVQEHYYASPPRIERGWREHLISTTGRSYLDMVNNVAVLGHGDPELADAVAHQMLLLNTNSRFVYESVVAFSEQLAETLPPPLDTVFMVNSGSEADDLALRLAMAATGRTDVVAVGEAYHGWTYATDAVSTSVADNPTALSTRPSWVHVVDAPNSYRGKYRGLDATKYASDAAAQIERLAETGRAPAAFICEPYYGNAGGMPLPDGYLETVYAQVRRHGGLCIADEVQVGYGRLGRWFWGFEQQAVVPDIVTVAKAMGNGHPLGAVVTSQPVADRYRTQGYFFSSAGGSPVSSVVGSVVLNAIRERNLQANARDVGAHLTARLQALADKYSIIGTVHGSGLYLGVELVRDRETLEPAVEETDRICERLRHLGVILQATGDRLCVLKIKPPLLLDRAGADFFVDALDHVLATGY